MVSINRKSPRPHTLPSSIIASCSSAKMHSLAAVIVVVAAVVGFLYCLVRIVLVEAYAGLDLSCAEGDASCDAASSSVFGRYSTWEEAPSSSEEFDHDNDKTICRLPIISVEEWERGLYWEREEPVIVRNVTDGWMALEHWTKEEILRRYPDIVVGMGRSKDLGQTGPDNAGDKLTKTTIKDFVINHMHDPHGEKYVFDRKIKIPDELLEDCKPFPMPTRMFADYGPAMKGMIPGAPQRTMWKDHLALTIGRDLQGLTFHRHNAAWNVVVFGAKRWILYDAERIKGNTTRLKRMTRDVVRPVQPSTSEWIRTLYRKDERMDEIRNYGHDCVQRAGELIYVPSGWAHMVVNIGDTVAVVSERGLDAMES